VVGGDMIESQMTAETLYDYLVNGGLSITKMQNWAGVKQDGKLGKQTIQAINKKGECKYSALVLRNRGDWLFVKMKQYRPQTYQICKRGWANRVNIQIQHFNKTCNEKLSFYRV
jgi:lysozyme family protein